MSWPGQSTTQFLYFLDDQKEKLKVEKFWANFPNNVLLISISYICYTIMVLLSKISSHHNLYSNVKCKKFATKFTLSQRHGSPTYTLDNDFFCHLYLSINYFYFYYLLLLLLVLIISLSECLCLR